MNEPPLEGFDFGGLVGRGPAATGCSSAVTSSPWRPLRNAQAMPPIMATNPARPMSGIDVAIPTTMMASPTATASTAIVIERAEITVLPDGVVDTMSASC